MATDFMDSFLHIPNPTFENPAWETGSPRILILRLSAFTDVERSTPHHFLFQAARRGAPGSYIDMAFLPPPGERKRLTEAGLPFIRGVQSHRALADFDLALVSNSCIPELVNLPLLLRGSGIPLWASGRGEEIPALIMGGSSAAAAQGIIKEDGDCMADALFFGEGEGAVEEIASHWSGMTGAPKRARIRVLSDRIAGLWPAGDLTRAVRKAVAADAAPTFSPSAYSILPGEDADTARLEITRGCPCLCSFCFEGFDRTPFRETPAAELLRAARDLKASSGARTLELSSFNFNTHEAIQDLLLELNRLFFRVNAMSQRVDILAAAPGLAEAEIAADKRSFTLGIEGISGRQRRFLHKSLGDADISRVMDLLHRPKVRELKLFYILTGRETGEDVEEFAGFLRSLAALRARRQSKPRIVISFGLLVRMPGTPLRHDALLLDEKLWKPLMGKIRGACAQAGFELRFSSGWTDYLFIQLLAMGGYGMHALLERLVEAGAAYDRVLPPAADAVILAWMAENRSFIEELEKEKGIDYPFALSFLETPEERAFLHKRYLEAKAGVDDGYCRRGEPAGCADCPGCTRTSPVQVGPARAAAPVVHSAGGKAREIAELLAAKSRLTPLYVDARIPEAAASSSSAWHAAFLLRELLRLLPDQTDNVLSVREVLSGKWMGEGSSGAWHGACLAEIIAWKPEQIRDALARADWSEDGARFSPRLPENKKAPERFSSIELDFDVPAGAEREVLDALRAQHIRFTIKREADAYALEPVPQSVKKGLLVSGGYKSRTEGVRFRVEAGWKLDAAAFFRPFTHGPVRVERVRLGDAEPD